MTIFNSYVKLPEGNSFHILFSYLNLRYEIVSPSARGEQLFGGLVMFFYTCTLNRTPPPKKKNLPSGNLT